MQLNYLYIVGILLFSSFVQSFSGFGFALLTIPVLSLIIDFPHAVALTALWGLVINLLLLKDLWKHINFKNLKYLYIGSIIGIPIGIIFLLFFEPKLLKLILAIVIILFIVFSLKKNEDVPKLNNWLSVAAGFFSGFLGGALSTNGPPIIIYLHYFSKTKEQFKASITGFFIVSSIIIVSSHLISGISDAFVFKNFFYFSPIVLIGYFLGKNVYKKVNHQFFDKTILFLLLLISILLLI